MLGEDNVWHLVHLPEGGGADITYDSICEALGYVPADDAEIAAINETVDRLQEIVDTVGTGVYTDPDSGEETVSFPTWQEFQSLSGTVDSNTALIAQKADKSEIPSVPVQDVQVNGESTVTGGVARIPKMAPGGVAGEAAVASTFGTTLSGDVPYITILKATESQINERSTQYNPIVPATLDHSVKAAMTDGIGAAWTDAEKAAARARMSAEADPENMPKIVEINITEQNQSYDFVLINRADGVKYKRARIVVTAPKNTDSSITSFNGYVNISANTTDTLLGPFQYGDAETEHFTIVDIFCGNHPAYAEFTTNPTPFKVAATAPVVRCNGRYRYDLPYFTHVVTQKNGIGSTGNHIVGTKIEVFA